MLSLLCVLLGTAVTAAFGLRIVSKVQTQSSDQILALTCREQTGKLNQELLGIEGSVDACAELVTTSLTTTDLTDDAAYLAKLDEIEQQVGSIAQNTSGVCTYYLRVGRDLSQEPEGFFYTRKSLDSDLTKESLTPIAAYDPSDTEHVGWFYQPAEAGHAIWMEPYYNQNIDVYMVSYVVPIFVDGNFMGVVGMDVNLTVIIDAISRINPYKTGTAFLVSDEGTVYYHPEAQIGSSIAEYAPELGETVKRIPTLKDERTNECVSYHKDGIARKLAACSLRNGMVLMLAVDTSEINAPVSSLLRTAAISALVMSLLAMVVVVQITNRITKPLVQLTHVAGRIAEGDMNVELPEAGDDEVGVLTNSLDVTVKSLRTFIEGMHEKAYRDALTSVKNKAAFDEASVQLQEQMTQGDDEFGLLMVDVNYLKVINDQFGHERGDDYLRTCCQMVCHVFDHSPVYRIGGDEFVVVLRRGDYQQREALLKELDRRMVASQQEDVAWRRVSIAKGLALREPGDTSVDDVLRRADQAMYEDKRRMRAER